MMFFIIYFIGLMVCVLVVLPFIKARHQDEWANPSNQILMALSTALWPVTIVIGIPMVLIVRIMAAVIFFVYKIGAKIFDFMYQKFLPKQSNKEAPQIDEVNSGYRNIEFKK